MNKREMIAALVDDMLGWDSGALLDYAMQERRDNLEALSPEDVEEIFGTTFDNTDK